MHNNSGFDPVLRYVWPLLAAVAGSITALSFKQWQKMTRMEIVFSLFVGASFATFVGPIVAEQFLSLPRSNDYRWFGFTLYALATGSNVLLPLLVNKIFPLAVNKLAQLLGFKSEGGAP